MLNMGVSLKALLGVRAGGALAKKTNLQPVVVTQTVCVVLGSFWSLHLDSSFCSGVTAEADVCCRDLCENQEFYWFLLFLLPSPRCLGSLCSLAKDNSCISSAFPGKCLEHRGASKVPLPSSRGFSFSVLAQTWLLSTGAFVLCRCICWTPTVLLWCGWCSSAPDL